MRRPIVNSFWNALCASLFLLLLTGCAIPPATTRPVPTAETPPAPTAVVPSSFPPPSPVPIAGLLPYISSERLIADIAALTAIRPYTGWRSPASPGEAEARAYVAIRLGELSFFQGQGLTWKEEPFHTVAGATVHQADLTLTISGQEVPVPVAAMRSFSERLDLVARFDSDGTLGDNAPDPRAVGGPAVLLRSTEAVAALERGTLAGQVAFLDYALVDPAVVEWRRAVDTAWAVLAARPAGLVVVTQDSDHVGQSHGTFVADGSPLAYLLPETPLPILYARLEDLAPAGLAAWTDLEQIESAALTWDVDAVAPGTSANLVARIPGDDSSHAVILGAHIDSADSPGALDDAAGAAILLEVARVLDGAGVRPAVDLYLVWFGAEEAGLLGSYAFAAAHPDLLDRTLLALIVDCPTLPLPGVAGGLRLRTWAAGYLGDDQRRAPNYLAGVAARYGLGPVQTAAGRGAADNLAMATFDVPNAQLLHGDPQTMAEVGGLHYAGRIHDPYDTVNRAWTVADEIAAMAKLALAAAVEAGRQAPALRDTPPPQYRALLVSSHCEVASTSPGNLADFAATLAEAGYDVDTVPYGQAVTAADLAGAALVVVLPVLDYPTTDDGVYDESWSAAEAACLTAYVAQGGLLVLTNSADQRDLSARSVAANEDWAAMNALGNPFDIAYSEPHLDGDMATVVAADPVVSGVPELQLAPRNGVGFTLSRGTVLATVGGAAVPTVALVEHGAGRVLVLADAWMLMAGWDGQNAAFWRNLAATAQRR